jgi:hypothetical protein
VIELLWRNGESTSVSCWGVMKIDKKRKKAPGRDGIQNESWIYGTEREVDRLLEIMNGVWKGEGFPQEWAEGIICPIYKKG